MPFTETITIINNSGKIVKTGKHLFGIFKEAKASYQEKKDAIRAERGIQRAQTFDVSARSAPLYDDHHDYYLDQHHHRPRLEDGRSYVSSSSRRSHGSRRSRSVHRSSSRAAPRPALTETNLKTLSEVSGPSGTGARQAYRSPYAETAPRDMALSRPTLVMRGGGPPTEMALPVSPRQPMTVHRAHSDPDVGGSSRPHKEVDLNLAYGNVPPDLASRVDLDPSHAVDKEIQAKTLVQRVEGLLDEAHCLHHTATAIMAHLQGNPEAAAAVALTLAELSSLLTKMSPAFLSVLKGGSPAVFALLASPQFLIGAGVAVGVTIVMFGGWKIIKRIKEEKAAAAAQAQAQAMAFEAYPPGVMGMPPPLAPGPPPSEGIDEALVLEEELSTIESWRRGIVPFGEEDSADVELISPEAERAMREHRRHRDREAVGPDDSVSRVGMARSERSARTGRSGRSHRTSGSGQRGRKEEIPERRSSRAGTHRDGESSAASERSRASKRRERTEVKAIEASKVGESELDLVLRPKEKKGSMLKTLFKKKKEREDAKVAA